MKSSVLLATELQKLLYSYFSSYLCFWSKFVFIHFSGRYDEVKQQQREIQEQECERIT